MSDNCKCKDCGCNKWQVDIIESESGWGQKVDETREFDSKGDAERFVLTFNEKNNEDTVPEIYWYAQDPYQKRK